MSQPEFNIGDRVRLRGRITRHLNPEGVVVEVFTQSAAINWDGLYPWGDCYRSDGSGLPAPVLFMLSDLERVP